MKQFSRVLALALAALLTIGAVGAVAATKVNVRIETPTQTLFNGQVTPKDATIAAEVAGTTCANNTNPANVTGVNALSALIAAATSADLELTGSGDKYSFGVLVCRVATFAGDATNSWMMKVNNDGTALPDAVLKPNDTVLWYYAGLNADFSTIQTGTLDLKLASKVRANKNTTGRVWSYANSDGKRTPAAGAKVKVGGKTFTATKTGAVKLRLPAKGNFVARATGTAVIPGSDRICVFKKKATECKS